MMPSASRNRLAGETSPYLLQHATNPVHWHPWGEAALNEARQTGKPILLSIGYSACHWCHVMAHESFEDEASAQLMNEHFVNIKVDREERPDIDRVYQTAHQLLTQRPGGWPLTMFLSPDDQRPFFGGTYFPREARQGMPAFADLLTRIADHFRQHQEDVKAQGEKLVAVLGQLEPRKADVSAELTDAPLVAAREKLARHFDREYGGIGSAPKFPHPASLERLLRHWRATASLAEPDVEALFMVSLTLARMAEGGLFDQLQGGFFRYSVDRFWQIPHFEKMLYDNGPLLALYAQAYTATGEALFARVTEQTAAYLLDDMRADNGGFFATRDADSEGEEGRYYAWTPEQVQPALREADYPLFARHFGLDQEANFEGRWHLSVRESAGEIAADVNMAEDDLRQRLDESRAALLAVRQRRVPPELDEKQLTAWNALAIRGLAVAGRSLNRADWIDAADLAARFIRRAMLRDQQLFASHKDGRTTLPAYLDDHAFLLHALLELLQARWHSEHLEFAVQLADWLLERFYDPTVGGFYFTAHDAEPLLYRPKPMADEATPSGNGAAAFALQRLGYLLGEERYLKAAEATLKLAWRPMSEFPHGHASLLTALEEWLEPPEIIVLRGATDELADWAQAIGTLYAPRRLTFAIDAGAEQLPGSLAQRQALPGQTVAYRCIGSECSLPITSWKVLAATLKD